MTRTGRARVSAKSRAEPRSTRRRATRNPADAVLRARAREPVRFPDLTERMALKLAALPHYTARVHFGAWHRRLGGPDFNDHSGIFTPLVAVELEATDARLDPYARLDVRGQTFLGKVVDASGAVVRLVREGDHTVRLARPGSDAVVLGRARLYNVFTRYDSDPARRRITHLPPQLGLGDQPSRLSRLPRLEDVVPLEREPDFIEAEPRVWHYGQTDPNRHVTGVEYIRAMERYLSEVLWRVGHDLRQVYAARARVVYRKPCFRGEAYRRAAWHGEDPLVLAGAVYKLEDPPGSKPAVGIEISFHRHEP